MKCPALVLVTTIQQLRTAPPPPPGHVSLGTASCMEEHTDMFPSTMVTGKAGRGPLHNVYVIITNRTREAPCMHAPPNYLCSGGSRGGGGGGLGGQNPPQLWNLIAIADWLLQYKLFGGFWPKKCNMLMHTSSTPPPPPLHKKSRSAPALG